MFNSRASHWMAKLGRTAHSSCSHWSQEAAEAAAVWKLRGVLHSLEPAAAIELLIKKIRETLGGQMVRMEDGFNPSVVVKAATVTGEPDDGEATIPLDDPDTDEEM